MIGFTGCVEENTQEKFIPQEKKTILLFEETKYIKYGEYYTSSTVMNEGDKIQVTTDVKQGGPVDVILLNSYNQLEFVEFMEKRRSSINFFKIGSALNVMSKSYTFEIPSTDRYFIIINNGGGFQGGAEPNGDVSVYMKVTYQIV